jgi:hypothetical protein
MQARACSLSRYSSCLSLCLALCALLAASPALADQEPLGASEDMQKPSAMTPADKRKRADPSVDRSVILPSAETLHQGDVTINSYELLGLGVSYGITDSIELSAITIIPAGGITPLSLLLSGKFQVVRLPSLLLSIQTTGGFIHDLDGFGSGIVAVGALLDIMIDSEGDYVFSASTQNGLRFSYKNSCDESKSGYTCNNHSESGLFSLSLAFNARVAHFMKLLLEVIATAEWADSQFQLLESATAVNYGVRFFGDTIALDLSLCIPVFSDSLKYLPIGFPYLAFSARF